MINDINRLKTDKGYRSRAKENNKIALFLSLFMFYAGVVWFSIENAPLAFGILAFFYVVLWSVAAYFEEKVLTSFKNIHLEAYKGLLTLFNKATV